MKTHYSKNIVWLASYPKSGNTWFRIFLSNLFSNSDKPVNINELEKTPIASNRFIFDEYLGFSSSEMDEQTINYLRPLVYRQFANDHKGLKFLKVHDAYTVNKNNTPIFPSEITQAVIYIVRNPLDISISFAHHLHKSLNKTVEVMNNNNFSLANKTNQHNKQLNQFIGSWSNHVNSWRNSKLPIHIIKYEDMVQDTLNTFLQAVNYLGLNFSLKAIEKALIFSNFAELKEQEQKHGFKEKPIQSDCFFRSGRTAEWKEYLPKELATKLQSAHFETMKHFKYL